MSSVNAISSHLYCPHTNIPMILYEQTHSTQTARNDGYIDTN